MSVFKTILDLCSGTGAWSKPYKDNGYNVVLIDLPNDIRLIEFDEYPIYGVLAAPPCTTFASSGARWWKEKGVNDLLDGLSIVDACLRIILMTDPKFWVLENPVGRLKRFLGPPKMYFHPCDYGDPYLKKTCLWGKFNIPKKTLVEPIEGMKLYNLPPSKNRSKLRSVTPPGFAKAFYEANK